jgi:hypothetical protein
MDPKHTGVKNGKFTKKQSLTVEGRLHVYMLIQSLSFVSFCLLSFFFFVFVVWGPTLVLEFWNVAGLWRVEMRKEEESRLPVHNFFSPSLLLRWFS